MYVSEEYFFENTPSFLLLQRRAIKSPLGPTLNAHSSIIRFLKNISVEFDSQKKNFWKLTNNYTVISFPNITLDKSWRTMVMASFPIVRFDGRLEISVLRRNKIVENNGLLSCPYCVAGPRHRGKAGLFEHYETCETLLPLLTREAEHEWNVLTFLSVGIKEELLPGLFIATFDFHCKYWFLAEKIQFFLIWVTKVHR